jgi:hypothetical protein
MDRPSLEAMPRSGDQGRIGSPVLSFDVPIDLGGKLAGATHISIMVMIRFLDWYRV